MTSIAMQYSIVQYHDDPLRDEPRNIGIVLRDPRDEFVAVRFLEDSKLKSKLKLHATEDFKFVQTYIAQVRGLQSDSKQSKTGLELPLKQKPTMRLNQYVAFGKIKVGEPRGILVTDIDREADYLFHTFVTARKEDKQEKRHLFKTQVKGILSEHNLLKHSAQDQGRGFAVNAVIRSKHSKVDHRVDFLNISNAVTVLESVDLRKINSTETERETFEAALKLEDLRQSYGKRNFRGFAIVVGAGASERATYCMKVLSTYSDDVVDFSRVGMRNKFLGQFTI